MIRKEILARKKCVYTGTSTDYETTDLPSTLVKRIIIGPNN